MTPTGAIILYTCTQRAARPTAAYVIRHGHPHGPQRVQEPFVQFKASATTYFRMTRNQTRTRTAEAPFTQILIPKRNEAMKKPATRKRATATMHSRNTPANNLVRHKIVSRMPDKLTDQCRNMTANNSTEGWRGIEVWFRMFPDFVT